MRKIYLVILLSITLLLSLNIRVGAGPTDYVNCADVYWNEAQDRLCLPRYYSKAICCCDKGRCYASCVPISERNDILCGGGYERRDIGCGTTCCVRTLSSRERNDNCGCTATCGELSCDEGYVEVPNEFGYKEVTCTDDCGQSSKFCYCPDCITSCPKPLRDTQTPNLVLLNFRECTTDCEVERKADCYEDPSPQPTEVLSSIIDKDEWEDDNGLNKYGFGSKTHSGIPKQGISDLNDPITMVAEYTDIDGSKDIEAMLVWFRDTAYGLENLSTSINTPIFFDDSAINSIYSPLSSSTNSWGFMLRKVKNDWIPYVTSYQNLGKPVWLRYVGYDSLSKEFYIPSNVTNRNMVKVKVNDIWDNPFEGTMSVRFTLNFHDKVSNVKPSTYNILLMGLDEFSFTPYDNYDKYLNNELTQADLDKIKNTYWPDPYKLRYRTEPLPAQTYAKDWTPVYKWTIDKTEPIKQFNVEPLGVGATTLKVTFGGTDDKNLYAIVGNIYAKDMDNPSPIQLIIINPSAGVQLSTPNPFTPEVQKNTDVPGHLTTGWKYKVDNLDTNTSSNSFVIDIKENTKGILELHTTVFDDAGNMSSDNVNEIDLNDWIVTDGGLGYSEGGSKYKAKETINNWAKILPPFVSTNESLISSKADLSSEMWANKPSKLVKTSGSGSSYLLDTHDGYTIPDNNYYSYLLGKYELRKNSIQGLEEIARPLAGANTTLSESLSTLCTKGDYCVLSYTKLPGNASTRPLDITSAFKCDKKGLIFVEGDVNITPYNDTTVPSNINGCIFVIQGNLYIKSYPDGKFVNKSFKYDVINGYFFVNENITIEKDLKNVPLGVYINGGLHTQSDTPISILRTLRMIDKWDYPVLAIDGHPKYGVLGGIFFGSPIQLQKIEVGVKPY